MVHCLNQASHFMLKCHIFETLVIHSGSRKRVDSIYVQILKYLQHKLSTAENYMITHASLYHIIRKVSYKLSYSVCDEKCYSLEKF